MSLHPSIHCSSDTPQTSNRLDPFSAFQAGKSPENGVAVPRAHLHRQHRSGSVLVFVSKDSGPTLPSSKGQQHLVSFSKSRNLSSLVCLYSEQGPAGHQGPSTGEQILGSWKTELEAKRTNALLGVGAQSQGKESERKGR